MIKILPIKKDPDYFPRNKYFLEVTLGYGEHADDTYSSSTLEINDDQVLNRKYDDEGFPIDDEGFVDWSHYISVKEAEDLVKFFNKIFKKMNKYNEDHITINDWDKTWFTDIYHMTDKEADKLIKILEEYSCYLFNPTIDHNWYAIVNVKIIYYDIDGNKHDCEVY